MDEIQERYALNGRRQRLFEGFARATEGFKVAGCGLLYLNGSFITAKEFPGDYDACWDTAGVKLGLLDPVLLEFANQRAAQKAKYLGEFFPANHRAERKSPFRTFLDFFQTDKNTGDRKGIIGIKLVRNV